MLVGAILGLMLGMVWAFGRATWADARQADVPEYHELRGLTQELSRRFRTGTRFARKS
jgi:hypothetical protein